jgi:hypothetical protein
MNNKIWPNEKGYIIVKDKNKKEISSVGTNVRESTVVDSVSAECEVIEHLYQSCQGDYYHAPLCKDMREKYKKCFGKNPPF